MQDTLNELNIQQFSAPIPVSVFEALRRKPLENVVLLKFLQNSPESVTGYHIDCGTERATMLVIDNQLQDFDRGAYPSATSTILISSDNPTLTQALVCALPRNETRVFKLANPADRDVVAQHFTLDRQRAILSYTIHGPVSGNDRITINKSSKRAPFELFEAQKHSRDWLSSLLDNGRAFTCTFEENDIALSACFAFQIDGDLWEVGGVYTHPQARRRKLAQSVVSAAVAELKRSNRFVRYQVEDTNTPSIRLAESLGMTHYFTLSHYLSKAEER